jgi:hypothetical protein
MSNSQRSNPDYCEYATVDTAPNEAGYWTNPVYPRKNKTRKLFFSIRETTDDSSPSVMTVKLQFKCPHDTGWQDHLNEGSDWEIGTRVLVEEFGEGVEWRAGVPDFSAYTSGSLTFGFDW